MPTPLAHPERVVIVARTKMGGGVCIGGMVEATGRAVRLLPVGKFCHPPQAPFQVGEIWEMCLRARVDARAPHIEDHDEWDARLVGKAADLEALIRSRCRVVRGDRAALFGGALRFTAAGLGRGKGYLVGSSPVPAWSVEFWELPEKLILYPVGDDARYRCMKAGVLDLKYVGFGAPLPSLPAGTLVRVSLARWFDNGHTPGGGEACWLQLSGWFAH